MFIESPTTAEEATTNLRNAALAYLEADKEGKSYILEQTRSNMRTAILTIPAIHRSDGAFILHLRSLGVPEDLISETAPQ